LQQAIHGVESFKAPDNRNIEKRTPESGYFFPKTAKGRSTPELR
jgi:hypothetical protein